MTATLAADLLRLSPTASKAIIQGIVDNAHLLDQARINTPIRLRHFFARVCVETGGLRALEENLSYTAERLVQVWPKRFPTLVAAKPYAKSPAKLAEKVYGGRLGNFKPGDGWTFRGSGLLQNTGRENFELVEDATGLPVVDQPELLRTFPGALEAATIFWTKRNINTLADKNDVAGVCKKVNGGTNGLADQKTWLAKAAKIWPDGAVIAFPAPAQPAAAPPVIDLKPTAPAPIPVAPDITPVPPAPAPAAAEKPVATSGKKAAAAASIVVLAGAAIVRFWHHITDLFWSIF